MTQSLLCQVFRVCQSSPTQHPQCNRLLTGAPDPVGTEADEPTNPACPEAAQAEGMGRNNHAWQTGWDSPGTWVGYGLQRLFGEQDWCCRADPAGGPRSRTRGQHRVLSRSGEPPSARPGNPGQSRKYLGPEPATCGPSEGSFLCSRTLPHLSQSLGCPITRGLWPHTVMVLLVAEPGCPWSPAPDYKSQGLQCKVSQAPENVCRSYLGPASASCPILL